MNEHDEKEYSVFSVLMIALPVFLVTVFMISQSIDILQRPELINAFNVKPFYMGIGVGFLLCLFIVFNFSKFKQWMNN